MNQDYMEQSGSYNGDGIRSSQINRRTYAWVVQPDMEITKRHLENKEKSKKKQVCFSVFLFVSFLYQDRKHNEGIKRDGE